MIIIVLLHLFLVWIRDDGSVAFVRLVGNISISISIEFALKHAHWNWMISVSDRVVCWLCQSQTPNPLANISLFFAFKFLSNWIRRLANSLIRLVLACSILCKCCLLILRVSLPPFRLLHFHSEAQIFKFIYFFRSSVCLCIYNLCML